MSGGLSRCSSQHKAQNRRRTKAVCRYGSSPFFGLFHRRTGRTVSDRGRAGRAQRGRQTLQDASMLWIVTQTEMTLSTGDHSLPRMDAHICMRRAVSGAAASALGYGGRAYMAIRIYVLRWGVRFTDCGRGGERRGVRGEWVPCRCRRRRTVRRARRSGIGCRTGTGARTSRPADVGCVTIRWQTRPLDDTLRGDVRTS